MRKRNFTPLMVILLLVPIVSFSQTFTSIASGNWHDAAIWDQPTAPTTGSDVIIDGHDVYIESGASVASVLITNINTVAPIINDAQLDVRGGLILNITGNLRVKAENVAQNVFFKASSSSIIAVGGDLLMERSSFNVTSSILQLALSNSSQLVVTGKYTFNYLSSGSENSPEINISNSSRFTVSGLTTINQEAGANFSVLMYGSSICNFNDTTLIKTTGGSGLGFVVDGGASMSLAKELKLSANGGAGIDFNISNGATVSSNENLFIESNSTSSVINVNVTDAGSTLDLNKDLKMVASAQNIANLNLSLGSDVHLAGSVLRPSDFGNLTMTDIDHFIFDGMVAQTIPRSSISGAGTDAFEITNIVVKNPMGIDLDGDLVITKDLELDTGIITTSDTSKLIIADGASITGGSSVAYVSGPLVKKGSTNGNPFVFPVGSNGTYAPVEIEAISSPTVSYTAKFTGCPPPIGHLKTYPLVEVLNFGYWSVERNDSLLLGDLNFFWDDADAAGIYDLDALVVARHVPIVGWFSLGQSDLTGGTGSGVSGSIKHDTGCPPPIGSNLFALGTSENLAPLPVELIRFVAYAGRDNSKVFLEWETESEINSDHFIVEKSYDGATFFEIARVDAAQNSTTIQYYDAVDDTPSRGNNYYRIMSIDLDQTMSFSRLVNLFIKENDVPVIYPNPVKDYVRVYGKSLSGQEVLIKVHDMSGQCLYRNRHDSDDGHLFMMKSSLNIHKPGTYLLSIEDGGEVHTMKFMILE